MAAKSPQVTLPTLHPGQVEIYKNATRLNAVRCGRRFGKTKMLVTLAADGAVKGKKVGLFTPEHKQLYEPYTELLWILNEVKTKASKTDGVIATMNGGQIDFWALNDNELAGRGREYDLVMIDEAAFTKDSQMYGIWEKSINPTMLTRPNSKVWVFSTPYGSEPENFFWRICNKATKFNFKEHYAPTSSNPLVTPEFLERERLTNHPQVFLQEYLAEFVDWRGIAFFDQQKMLVEGKPVEFPVGCESVLAVIDTAVKTGKEHDATAVTFFAKMPDWFDGGYKLVILDWDLVQIEGALLETWIPSVFSRLEELAKKCKAIYGSIGAWIEDAQSGSILLQQCALRGYPAEPLPAQLTAAGKDTRAINASGPVYRGEVKFSRHAFEKTTMYKGVERNHLLTQVTSFRIGDKDAAKRSDDALDTFTYGISITLGGSEGIA